MSNKSNLDDMNPVEKDNRTMSLWSYIPMWWASVIVVQSFSIVFFAVYPQGSLSISQVLLASVIAPILLVIFFTLNGFPGLEKGIPYAIQTRSSFGVRGSKIPNIIRIIPAITWLGIGNWIGALAINTITTAVWGFGNTPIYFVLFTILNMALAWYGIRSIKWFNVFSSLIVVVLLAYTAYTVLTTTGIPTRVIEYQGEWNLQFIAVISAIVGNFITGALNVGDLTRHLEINENSKGRNMFLGHLIGIIPSYIFILGIGVLFGAATGNPNPVNAIMDVAPNVAFGSLMLLFIILAQISTNLTLNLLPPSNVFQDIFDISWKQGILLTTIISGVTFPWLIYTSSWFNTYINVYSAFLGPVLGILIADYWVVRKRNTDVPKLYDSDEGSRFWFINGISVTGMVSMIIGVVSGLIVIDASWILGFPIGFISYVLLSKYSTNNRVRELVSSQKDTDKTAGDD